MLNINTLLINGPNINLLGTRETKVYGTITLKIIEKKLILQAKKNGIILNTFHSNCECKIINKIHLTKNEKINSIIINPGGLTHTSIILRDALIAINIPFIEVHISNIYKREKFRNFSYLSDVAIATLCGFGIYGYKLAIDYLIYKQLSNII